MKILFDTQIFDWQVNGGISRYFVELFKRLDKDKNVDVLFECTHSYNTYIQNTKWLKNTPFLQKPHFKGKLSAAKLINQQLNRRKSNRILKSGEFDIFHPTYYDPYFLGKLDKPLALTVYDLTIEKFNDHSPLTNKVLEWKKKLISKADHIISISENTKKDIIQYYGIDPRKITTVYLSGGFDPHMLEDIQTAATENIPQRYILFVGSRSSYKNFMSFIEEAAPVMKRQDISLVIAGGNKLKNAEQALLQKLKIHSKTIVFPQATDSFLAHLYTKAMVFVFPSLYEGFGLPVLEAMQCGCPVLLSNNSSLPEVGGSAAAYFDPLTKSSLQNQLDLLINDIPMQARMVAAGREQVKKFNWDLTSDAHQQVYQDMIIHSTK